MIPEVSARHEALSHCLQKLHARDRELVLSRYEPGCGVEVAAQRSGRLRGSTRLARSRTENTRSPGASCSGTLGSSAAVAPTPSVSSAAVSLVSL